MTKRQRVALWATIVWLFIVTWVLWPVIHACVYHPQLMRELFG